MLVTELFWFVCNCKYFRSSYNEQCAALVVAYSFFVISRWILAEGGILWWRRDEGGIFWKTFECLAFSSDATAGTHYPNVASTLKTSWNCVVVPVVWCDILFSRWTQKTFWGLHLSTRSRQTCAYILCLIILSFKINPRKNICVGICIKGRKLYYHASPL